MRTREDLLDRRPEEGARVVALDLVAEVDAAAGRLAAAEDGEALHDFRVALRRLRSTLRSYRPWLREGVRRKAERRLRKVSRATTSARDAEVQLAWLAAERAGRAPGERAAVDWLAARIAPRRSDVDGPTLARRWRRAAKKLRTRLVRVEVRLDRDPEDGPAPTLAAALAPLLVDALDAVHRRLGRVRGASDVPRAHAARIEAKRLRYLLEPLRGAAADGARAVKQLKALQDVLGELHDAHVLEGEIAAALDDVDGASDGGGSPRAGLHALAVLARERRDALWAQLERARHDGALAALDREVRAVVAALARRAGAPVPVAGREAAAGDGAAAAEPDDARGAPPSPS